MIEAIWHHVDGIQEIWISTEDRKASLVFDTAERIKECIQSIGLTNSNYCIISVLENFHSFEINSSDNLTSFSDDRVLTVKLVSLDEDPIPDLSPERLVGCLLERMGNSQFDFGSPVIYT